MLAYTKIYNDELQPYTLNFFIVPLGRDLSFILSDWFNMQCFETVLSSYWMRGRGEEREMGREGERERRREGEGERADQYIQLILFHISLIIFLFQIYASCWMNP